MSSSDRQDPPLANINQLSPMRPSDIHDASRPPAPEKGTRLRPAENVAPCPLPTDAHTPAPAPSPSASPSVPSSNPTPSFPFVPDSTSRPRCSCRDVPPSPSFVKRFEEVLRRFEELYPGEKLDDATTSDQCKTFCIRCALERAKNNTSLPTPQVPSENTNPPKNTNNPVSVSETAATCGVSPVEGALTVPSPEKKSDSVPTSPTPLEEPKPTQPLVKDDPSTLPSRESDPRIDINLTPVKPDPPPLPHAACPHSESTNRLPTSNKTMSPLPPSIFDNPASSLPPSIFYNPASSLPPSIPDNRAVSPLPPIPANPPPSLRSSISNNATPLLTYRKNNTRGPSFAEHLECLLKKLYSVSTRPGEKDSDTTFPPGNANPSPVQSAASSRLDSTTCLPKSDNTAPSLHASIPGSTAPIRASISTSTIPSLSSSIPGTTPSLPSSIPSSTHSICSCKDITRAQSFEEHLDVSIKRPSTMHPRSEVKGVHSSTSDSSEKSFFWPSPRLPTPQVCPHRDDTSSSPGLTSPETIHPEDTNTSGPLSDLPPPLEDNTSSVCLILPSGKVDTSSAPALDISGPPNASLETASRVPLFDLYSYLAMDPSFFAIASSDLSGATCSVTHLVDGTPSLPASLDTDGTPSASLKPLMLEKSTSTPLFDLDLSLAVDPSFFPIVSSDSSVATCSVPPLVDGSPSLPASLDTDGTPSASLKPHMLQKSTSAHLLDLYPSLAVDPSFFPIASSDSSSATCSVPPLVNGTPSFTASLDTDGTPSASLKPHMLEKSTSTHLLDLYSSLAVDPSFFPMTLSDSSSATCSVPLLVDGTPSLPASLDTDGTPSASLKPHMLEKSTSTPLFDLYPSLAVDPSFFPTASSDLSVATCSVPPLVDGTPSFTASLDTDGTPSASLKPHILEKSTSTSLFDLYPPLAVDPSFFPTASSDSSVATCPVPPLVDGSPSLPASLDTDGTPSSSLKPHMLQKSTSTHLLDLYSSLAVDPSFFPIAFSDSSSATCSVPPLVDGTPSLPASLDTDGTPSASLKPHMLQKSTSTHLLDLYSSLAVDPSFFPIASSDSSSATCSVPPLVDGSPSLPASLDTDGTPSASLKPHMLEKSTSTSLFDLYPSLAVDPSFFPIASSDSSVATCSVPPLVDGSSSLPASLDTDGTPSASLKPHMLQKSTSTHLLDLYSSLAVDPSFFPIASSDSSSATCSVPPLVDGTPSLPASLDTDGTPSASLKPHMFEKSTSTHLLDLYPSLAVDPSFFPIASSDSRGATCSVPPLVDGTPTLPESMDTDVPPSASLKPNVLETGSLFHPSENIDSSEYRHICPYRLKYLHVWRPLSGRPAPLLREWSTFIVVVPVSDTDIPNLWVPAPSVTNRLTSPSEDTSVCFLTITDSSVPPLLDVTIPTTLGVDGNLFDHRQGISDTFSTPVLDANVSPCTTSYIDLTTPAPAATYIYSHSSNIISLAPVPSRTTTPIVDSISSASLFRKDASSSPPTVYTDFARPPEATTPIVESGASSSRLSVDTDFYRTPEVTTPIVESGASSSPPSVHTEFARPPEATTPIVESGASTSRLSVDTDFARPPEVTTPIVESGASSSPPSVYTDFARQPEATTPIVESGASSSPLSVDTDRTLLSGSTLQESGFLLPPTMDMNPSVPPLEKAHSCAAPSIEYKNMCFPLKKYQHLWSTLEGIPTSLLSQRIADMSLPGCSDHSAPSFMSPDLPPQPLGKSESVLVPSGIPDYSSSTTEKAYVSISQQHDLPVLLSEETSSPVSVTETTKPSIPRPETIEVSMSGLDKAESSFSTTEKTNHPPFFPEETSRSISGEEKTDFPVSTEKMDPSAHTSENSVLSMPTLEKMDSPACFLETEKCDASPSTPVKDTLFVKVELSLSATEKIDPSISSPVKSDFSLSCPVKSNTIVISSVKTEVSVETGIPVVSPENNTFAVELPVESGAQDVSPVKTDLFAPFLMETDVQDVSPVATDDLVVSPGGKMLSFGSALESDAQDISPVKTDLSDTSLLQSNTQDVSLVKTNLSITSPVKTDIQDVFPVKSDLSVASPMATDVPVVSPEKNNISVAFVEESDIHDIFPVQNDLSVVPSGKNDIQAVNQVKRSVTFDTDILTLSYERDSEARAPCCSSCHSQSVVSCGNVSPSVSSLWDDDESCGSSQLNLNSSICPNYACTCAASPSDLAPSVFMPGNTPPTASSSSCSFSHGVSTNNLSSSLSSSRIIEPLAYSLQGDDENVCFRGSSCSVCPKNISSSVSTHGSKSTCSWSSFTEAKPLAYSLEGDDEGACFRETSHSVCPKNVATSVSTPGNNATCSWSLFRKTEPLAYSLQSDDENVCFRGTNCSVCPKNFTSSVSTHGNSDFYSSLQTTDLPTFSSRDASPCSICDTKVSPPASPPESTDPWANYLDDVKNVTSSYRGTLCPKHAASSASHLGSTDPCSPSLEIRDFSASSSSGDVSRHCTYKRHVSPSASGASSLKQTALFSSSSFDSCSCTLPSKNISSAFSSPGKSCPCSQYTSTSDPYALSTEETYTSELCPIRTYLYLFRSMKYDP
ncbi:serine-rich adhesin for platelets-like [Pleurodeles waltl]|uniref:serine-rich adhesin for platelets-like n=1 Tax=Pleurodeles waltl TaxID=8319 RepID=UPI003709B25D